MLFHLPLDKKSICGTGLSVYGMPTAESILVKLEGVVGFLGNRIAWPVALLVMEGGWWIKYLGISWLLDVVARAPITGC